jgi:hypothetical protein
MAVRMAVRMDRLGNRGGQLATASQTSRTARAQQAIPNTPIVVLDWNLDGLARSSTPTESYLNAWVTSL